MVVGLQLLWLGLRPYTRAPLRPRPVESTASLSSFYGGGPGAARAGWLSGSLVVARSGPGSAAGPAWRLPLGMVVVVESVRLRPRLLRVAWPGRNLRRQWSGVRSVSRRVGALHRLSCTHSPLGQCVQRRR